MTGWFLFSALLSSYNKTVFGDEEGGGLAFPCPLLMTSFHFCAQWIFAETLCFIWPEYFGSDRISQMGWKHYFDTSLPCGLVTSADIGLSNLSWVSLSLTFYTMIKSSTPIFVLFWAYLFGITRITPQLIGVVILITAGEFIIVAGELNGGDFKMNGFILCLSASILSGARWTLVQLKIQSLTPPLKTTIATMRLLAPSMFLSLFFTSMLIERPWIKLGPMNFSKAVEILGLGLFGAIFAIAMIMCEFYLIMKANAIILALGGVIKEVITIFVGVIFFGDKFTLRTFFGCCVIFSGVIMYKFAFQQEKDRKKELGARRRAIGVNNDDAGGGDGTSSASKLSTSAEGEEHRGLLHTTEQQQNNKNANHEQASSRRRDLLRLHENEVKNIMKTNENESFNDKIQIADNHSDSDDNESWVMPEETEGIELGHHKTTPQRPSRPAAYVKVGDYEMKIV